VVNLTFKAGAVLYSEPKPQMSIFWTNKCADKAKRCRIKLSYRILNEWYLTVLPSFSIKWRYTNIEPVLNSIPIKLHRVFLSHNVVTVSSHYLIFHQHMYARQLSNRSILHAGRYLNDKEICYLGTVIVTANVCRGRL